MHAVVRGLYTVRYLPRKRRGRSPRVYARVRYGICVVGRTITSPPRSSIIHMRVSRACFIAHACTVSRPPPSSSGRAVSGCGVALPLSLSVCAVGARTRARAARWPRLRRTLPLPPVSGVVAACTTHVFFVSAAGVSAACGSGRGCLTPRGCCCRRRTRRSRSRRRVSRASRAIATASAIGGPRRTAS